MKTDIQVQQFLAGQTYHSLPDWEMIAIFCKQHHHSTTDIQVSLSENGLTVSSFIEWYNEGFGSGDIVHYKDSLAIVSKCSLDEARVVARLKEDGKLDETWITVPVSQLSHATHEESVSFHVAMSENGRQYYHGELKLGQKKIPGVNERVEFWGHGDFHGVGVVRGVDIATGSVELYCYYMYHDGSIGYSMHETGIVDLHSFKYEAMSVSQQRRLYRELERCGKKWYDKLHRIEPLEVKVEKGEHYWYINDKMKLVMDTEKGTPTSHFRYIGGNYFRTMEEGVEYLGRICEILRDRLSE